MKTIELSRTVTYSNDLDAEALKEDLNRKHTLLVNVMSSAGAGKTTLLMRLLTDLGQRYRIGVVEADIDSTVDAERIEQAGGVSIQAHTDGMCHMDAGMTRKALDEFDGEPLDLVFLENVGNLICPAEYDTGAQKRVMLLSVPEGDDKPLKYPLMFRKSDALVITKCDTSRYFNFSIEKCMDRVVKLNESIRVFPVSAKTGEGMDAFEEWLIRETEAVRSSSH